MYMDKRKLDKKKTDTICIVKKTNLLGLFQFCRFSSAQLGAGSSKRTNPGINFLTKDKLIRGSKAVLITSINLTQG